MSRLPNDHSDNETWGAVLNDFLLVAHNADGTAKAAAGGSSSAATGVIAYGENSTNHTVTVSNNSWLTGTSGAGTSLGVSFKAPANGSVLITLSGMLVGGTVYGAEMSYSVSRNSNGASVVTVGQDGRVLIADAGPGHNYSSITRRLTGLVAGDYYTVDVQFRSRATAANTVSFLYKAVIVEGA